MKPGNKMILILFFVSIFGGFVSLIDAAPHTKGPISAGSSTAVPLVGAAPIDVAASPIPSARWSPYIHSFQACLAFSNNIIAKASAVGQAAASVKFSLQIGNVAAFESTAFGFDLIKGNKICHTFNADEVSTRFRTATKTEAINIKAVVTSIEKASVAVAMTLSVEGYRYIITGQQEAEITLTAGSKFHQVICQFAGCTIKPKTTPGRGVVKQRYLCTTSGPNVPQCAPDDDTAVTSGTYSVTSFACPENNCPAKILVGEETLTSTVTLGTLAPIGSCVALTVINSTPASHTYFPQGQVFPLEVCIKFNQPTAKCDEGALSIEFQLTKPGGGKTATFQGIATDTAQLHCVTFEKNTILSLLGSTNLAGSQIGTTVKVRNYKGVTAVTALQATVSISTKIYPVTAETSMTLDADIRHHVLICRTAHCKMATPTVPAGSTVTKSICTPGTTNQQPSCTDANDPQVTGGGNFIVMDIKCKAAGCASTVSVTYVPPCPDQTLTEDFSHPWAVEVPLEAKLLCVKFTAITGCDLISSASVALTLKLSNVLVLFTQTTASLPQADSEQCVLLSPGDVSNVIAGAATVPTTATAEMTIKGAKNSREYPLTGQIELRGTRVESDASAEGVANLPAPTAGTNHLYSIISTTDHTVVKFIDGTTFSQSRFTCDKTTGQVSQCALTDNPVTSSRPSVTVIQCTTGNCPTKYKVIDNTAVITAAWDEDVAVNDCAYTTTVTSNLVTHSFWPDNALHPLGFCVKFKNPIAACDGKKLAVEMSLNVKLSDENEPTKTISLRLLPTGNSFCGILETDALNDLSGKDLKDSTIGTTVTVENVNPQSQEFSVSLITFIEIFGSDKTTATLDETATSRRHYILICKDEGCTIEEPRRSYNYDVIRSLCTIPMETSGTLGPSTCESQFGNPRATATQFAVLDIRCKNGCPKSVTATYAEDEVDATPTAMGEEVTLEKCPTKTTYTSDSSPHTWTEAMGSRLVCIKFSQALRQCKEKESSELKLITEGGGDEVELYNLAFEAYDISNQEHCVLLQADLISTSLTDRVPADTNVKSSVTINSVEGTEDESTTFNVAFRSKTYTSDEPSTETLSATDIDNVHEVICSFVNCVVTFEGGSVSQTRYLCTEVDGKFDTCVKSDDPVVAGKYSLTSLRCKAEECPTDYTTDAVKPGAETKTKPALKKTTSSANTFHLLSVGCIMAVALAA